MYKHCFIYDNTGNIILHEHLTEGVTELPDGIDVLYFDDIDNSINLSTHRIVKIDMETRQPIIEKREPVLTKEERLKQEYAELAYAYMIQQGRTRL